MNAIAERVERGAALLDEKRPGWADVIDLERLNIRYGDCCILGQLATGRSGEEDDYLMGLREFGVQTLSEERELGFDASSADDDFAALTAAWRDLILSRRAGAGVTA